MIASDHPDKLAPMRNDPIALTKDRYFMRSTLLLCLSLLIAGAPAASLADPQSDKTTTASPDAAGQRAGRGR